MLDYNDIECHLPYQEESLPVDALPFWWTIQAGAGSPHVPAYFDLSIPLVGKNQHGKQATEPQAETES